MPVTPTDLILLQIMFLTVFIVLPSMFLLGGIIDAINSYFIERELMDSIKQRIKEEEERQVQHAGTSN